MGEPAGEHGSRTFADIDLTASGASAPVFTTPDLAPAAPPGVHERLARIERLLDADLAALGPSVVAASIDDLVARIDAVGARIDGAEWVPGTGSPDLAALVQRLESLDRRVDRLTLLVEAATAPLEESVESTDPAIRRVELALAGLAVLVQRLLPEAGPDEHDDDTRF